VALVAVGRQRTRSNGCAGTSLHVVVCTGCFDPPPLRPGLSSAARADRATPNVAHNEMNFMTRI